MNKLILRLCMLTIVLLVPVVASAQDGDALHPLLESRWTVNVGAFFPDQNFQLKANGALPGDEVDFDERVGVSNSETTPVLTARWRFGEKWSLWGQAWRTENSGKAELVEDVEWQDLVFAAGTNVAGGIDTSVVRIFAGRTMLSGPRHELGIGLGLHWFEIEAYLQGDVLTSEGDLSFARSSADAALPLPNIGGWYHFALTDRWLFEVQLDWLSASVGDYSGSLLNGAIGVQWQLMKNVGVSLKYQGFQLNGDITKNSWRGGAELENRGALLSITANW